MQAAPIIMAVAAAGSAVYGGIQASKGARSQAALYEGERKQIEVDAINQENDRRERLKMALAAQDASAASRGVDALSPTQRAMASTDTEATNDDIGTIRAGAKNGMRSSRISSKSYMSTSRSSVVGSMFEAGGSLFKGAHNQRMLNREEE